MAATHFSPRSIMSRVRRWRGSPVPAAALLMIAIADYVVVSTTWAKRETMLAGLLRESPKSRATLMTDWGTIINGPDGPRLYEIEESADVIVQTLKTHPETLYLISRTSKDDLGGGLAPWWHSHGANFALRRMSPAADDPPSRVTGFARELIAARYMPHEDSTAANLGDPDRTQTRLDWPGIAHDCAMLPLGVAAIVNLFYVPGFIRRRRREARLNRGLCPRCCYALGGLPAGASCPECGEVLPADGTAAA